jgi:Fic family protein
MKAQGTSQAAGDLLRRIESEYREMPGLTLTIPQAQRLWGMDQATCLRVLTLLVARRVLKRTPAGRYLRAQ